MTPELLVILTAASPVVEVRGSVPLGLFLGLPINKILLLSILGSILPVFPILFLLTYLIDILRKIKILDQFFSWLFAHTRSKSKLVEELEAIGLAIFIAIPLPGTGGWTGSVAAYLFGIPWLLTFLAALVGTSLASLAVFGVSIGIIRLW